MNQEIKNIIKKDLPLSPEDYETLVVALELGTVDWNKLPTELQLDFNRKMYLETYPKFKELIDKGLIPHDG